MDRFTYLVTILGLALTILVSILIKDRNKSDVVSELELRKGFVQEIQDDAKTDLIRMFLNEVQANLTTLNKGYETNKYGNNMYLNLFFKDAYDFSKSSGVYSKFHPNLITTISSYYGGVDRWNELVKMYEGEERALVLQKIYNVQSQHEIDFRKGTEDVIKLLEREE